MSPRQLPLGKRLPWPETAYGRTAVVTSLGELEHADYPLHAPEPGAILMNMTRTAQAYY